MDALKGYGELGLGSRLKRISEYLMKETQLVYDYFNIDFDPYLFPTFKTILNKDGVTNSEMQSSLRFSQPAITQSLNKLNEKGLIKFELDTLDKRKKKVFPSAKGLEASNQLQPIWAGIEKVIQDFTLQNSSSLIEHLNKLEHKLSNNSFSKTIIENIDLQTTNAIEIVQFESNFAKYFYDLNVEWLKTYFSIEPFDEEVLSKPQKYIIDKGGHIFFAKKEEEIVGTVALMPLEDKGLFELTKMGVSPSHQGHKIGQQLLQYCIDYAKQMGLPKLILYSNRILENAIYIYRKYGFIEIPVEPNSPYLRSDIKMELIL